MEEIYTDKEILGDALTAEKTSTSVYNTFANECVHENVRNVMLKVLEEEHEIQDDVFKIMHKKGFYPTPEAEEKKVEEAKQKFACCVK
ncbi:MAG: spore coat protein [Eubacteriales bacterium]|nr:spore coat protein [Eubacteriales bacterium]